ncbi:hypothetical protein [Amaricoccus solimangrovi]|uniref:Uncharacterized protein n=1 Tax=Amaricoccus solimangrovi TaxID=2589815 RepID=A0A501WT97_9RHOB|nr:hypothetical protein [Amaricoccus solimangrovi]TPE52608.1 hypothetical protein FJM51_05365 [Amaricoccus solimangrovi]
MIAHRLDTWAEAAALVLRRIAEDAADPVNAHRFSAEDATTRRGLVRGWDARAGLPLRIYTGGAAICLRVPALTGWLHALTGLDPQRGASAVLAVARRIDPAAARYLPAEADE